MQCLKCREEIVAQEPKYGLHSACFTHWFKVDPTTEFVSLTQRAAQSLDPEVNNTPNNNSFYHGKFRKYSATLHSDNYILKMRDEKEAPELPEVEFVCNQIASFVGLPVPAYYYIDFHSQKTFVTKIFIKKTNGSENLEHIYKYREDISHECGTLAKVIQETTKRPYDLEVFYWTLLFDSLIGNHDRHGRNLAFIVTPTKTHLSPIYDNVSYLSLVSGPMLNADFNPTGRIATSSTKELAMTHYVAELKNLGQQELIRKFANRAKISKIEDLIDKSFCSNLMKKALKRLISKRHKELFDAL